MKDNLEKRITLREKVSIALVFFLIRIMKPYEYDTQLTAQLDEIKLILNGGDFSLPVKK